MSHDSDTPADGSESNRDGNDGGEGTSRRRLLAGTGLAVGAGVLGVSGSTLAQDDDETPTETPTGTETATPTATSDVEVLQYALTLERLEASFYRTAMERFGNRDFRSSRQLGHFGQQIQDLVFHFVETLGNHEEAHVNEIESVLQQLGASPEDPPDFTFAFQTVDEFLVTGRALENTGVAAYAGVAPRIQSDDLLTAALSIHSVEGRHAAFLNGITGVSPFPNAFDPALSMDQVLNAIQPFLGGEGTATETMTETEAVTETEAMTETETEMQ